jgi:hypothetical protein
MSTVYELPDISLHALLDAEPTASAAPVLRGGAPTGHDVAIEDGARGFLEQMIALKLPVFRGDGQPPSEFTSVPRSTTMAEGTSVVRADRRCAADRDDDGAGLS